VGAFPLDIGGRGDRPLPHRAFFARLFAGGLTMLRMTGIVALVVAASCACPAWAADWTYAARGAVSLQLPGGYGAVANPSTGVFYGDGAGNYAYPVFVDSGSSAFLMSNNVTTQFGIPLQAGQTYSEAGLGGMETMNVTQPLSAWFTPPNNLNPDNTSTLGPLGTFTFESRQSDSVLSPSFDIIGTAAFQNRILSVTPGLSYDTGYGEYGIYIAYTAIQDIKPTLPQTGTFHVPVTWTNFVTGTPLPTQGLNPVITGVTAKSGNTTTTRNWLFDSGAQSTLISSSFATELGIDLANDQIGFTIAEGVGGSFVILYEYQIDSLAIPLSNGDYLKFTNPHVFVIDSLPAELPAVLGANLFMQSTDNDLLGGGSTYAAPFSQWYLDGPGSELVLYDAGSSYSVPEPAAVTLLALGSLALLTRRPRARHV
jgi:hypothetical protein